MFTSLPLLTLPALAIAAPFAHQPEVGKRALAQSFVPPASSPLVQSSNYTGQNNGTLKNPPYKAGKVFDRIIHIWLENTDYDSAGKWPIEKRKKRKG